MKNRSMLILAVLVGSLWACESKEKVALRSKVDSLQVELQNHEQLAQALGDVGVMLDSIDDTRALLRTNVVEGTSYLDYKARLKDVHDHIRTTKARIESLEKSLSKSDKNNRSYLATIKRLKNDLESSTLLVSSLQVEVEKVRAENKELADLNTSKDTEITQKTEEIRVKEDHIIALEAKVSEVASKAKTDQADLYFAQAQALETAAARTHFAPRKKRETQREALELYKIALSLGKSEAQGKIDELEKVVS